jgi:hypothetical protein
MFGKSQMPYLIILEAIFGSRQTEAGIMQRTISVVSIISIVQGTIY